MDVAKIIYEYRSTRHPGPADEREEFSEAFLNIEEKLWLLINRHNRMMNCMSKFVVIGVPALNEKVVREAILNAVSHRNYQLCPETFIVQYPDEIVISNAGGFPYGVNQENIISAQNSRNRCLSDILSKCGYVEHAGQGMDLIYEQLITEAKPLPDFSQSNQYKIVLSLRTNIDDQTFFFFIRAIKAKYGSVLSPYDFLLLKIIYYKQKIPEYLRDNLVKLKEIGLIRISIRGTVSISPTIISDHKKNLEMKESNEIINLLIATKESGMSLQELRNALKNLSVRRIKYILDNLRIQGKAQMKGANRGARWFYISIEEMH